MKYNAEHILKLRSEVAARCDQLLSALHVPPSVDTIMLNACDIRLAVDDFKSILAEIKRLK